MVLNFEDLNILFVNTVQYLTGSYLYLGLFLCLVFLLILMGRGLDIRYSISATIPLLGFFVAIGWFGTVTNNQWIVNVGLIVVSIIYGTAVVKLST